MSDSFPISGSIDPKSFPYLIMDLVRNGATGSLKVEGPTYRKDLYFRGGKILFGSSNDPRDQLGAILIESGKISPDQLEDVNAKVGPGNPLAKVLSESGFVNQRELGESARAKVERILSDVLAYEEGSFEFEDGVLPKGAVDLKLSMDKLTIAAVRRIGERAFVLRHLGGLDAVLAPTAELHERLPSLIEELGGLPDQIDGALTLKEAASRTRLDEFEASKIACGLLFMGLVTRQEPPGAAASDVGEEPAAPFELGSEDSPLSFGAEEPAEEPAIFVSAPEPEEPVLGAEPANAIGFAAEPEDTIGFAAEPASDVEASGFTVQAEPAPELGFGDAADQTIGFGEESPALAEPEPEDSPTLSYAPAPGPVPVPTVEPIPEAFVPEPPRAAMPTGGPSKEDLEALDALLHSRPPEGPMAPLETTRAQEEPPWEPAFAAGRPSRRRSASRAPLWIGVGAAVVVLGGGAGWYFLGRPGPPTRVVDRVPEPAADAAPASAPTSSVVPQSTAPPAPAEAPPAAGSTAPAPPPTAAASAPAPTRPAKAGSSTPSALADARARLSANELPAAASAFAGVMRAQPAGTYTIQILVACAPETVTKAVANASAAELYVLPVDYKGRSCYRVCWGVYGGEASAGSAVSGVPRYFLDGGAKPKAVPLASMLP